MREGWYREHGGLVRKGNRLLVTREGTANGFPLWFLWSWDSAAGVFKRFTPTGRVEDRVHFPSAEAAMVYGDEVAG